MAVFTEDDVRSGQTHSPHARGGESGRSSVTSTNMKMPIGFLLITLCCAAQSVKPPELQGDGWRPLLDGHDTAGWHSRDGKPHTWYTAKEVHIEQSGTHTLLKGTGGPDRS